MPGASPWRNLLENGDEQSFLNLTGFRRLAFEELHGIIFNENEARRRGPGRPTLISTQDELGLFYSIWGHA
jgi:hypothetical protein